MEQDHPEDLLDGSGHHSGWSLPHPLYEGGRSRHRVALGRHWFCGPLIATSLWRYTRYAPLTKWGKIRTNSLCGGLAMICAASYLLLFKELSPEKVQAMYVVIALGTAALMLFAYALRRYRQVRSEATYNAEQIRRRIARRKRMELL